MKTTRQITAIFTVLMAATMLSSCEKEEGVATSLSGTWETTDQLFIREFRGQQLRTTKTVFSFTREKENYTFGDGYVIEYYDNALLPQTYHTIRWETWTRKNGDVGIEVKYYETHDKFSTISYNFDDQDFSGTCNLNDGPDQSFKFVRSTLPSLANVAHWGYNELIPTWHAVTYEGQLDIRRQYQGTTYTPTSVSITFDVDPAYNTSGPWNGKAFVIEKYDNAPWGTYLADSLRSWRFSNPQNLALCFAHSDNSWGDYDFQGVEVTENEMTGSIFVETNVFTPFILRRTSTPDWNTITKWGITNQF